MYKRTAKVDVLGVRGVIHQVSMWEEVGAIRRPPLDRRAGVRVVWVDRGGDRYRGGGGAMIARELCVST